MAPKNLLIDVRLRLPLDRNAALLDLEGRRRPAKAHELHKAEHFVNIRVHELLGQRIWNKTIRR